MAVRRHAAAVLCALGCLLAAAPAAPARPPGPALQDPEADRLAAIACEGDLAGAPRIPVLLVHGTGVTSKENWSWGYEHDLLARGHGVCTVQLPDRGWVDTQRSVEYVVTAVREMVRRSSGRKISIVGHSQGAALPVYALRIWPDLAPSVEDFVGLSGVYLNGSQAIRDDCSDGGCVASFWQFATGSKLLAALAGRPVPPGPSLTAIGTLADEVVTPQPHANELPEGRSVEIQDVCPGRRYTQDHIFMAADAVAHALAIDALDHPGPADPARIPRTICAEAVFHELDPVGLAQTLPALAHSFTLSGPDVPAEPALRCYLAPPCSKAKRKRKR